MEQRLVASAEGSAAPPIAGGHPAPVVPPEPGRLAEELEELRAEMRRRYQAAEPVLAAVHPRHRRSAANLVDYLTLRSHDIRDLQDGLAELGLSSLGRAEEHVITTVERVLTNLRLLAGRSDGHVTEAAVGFGEGRRALEANADLLLGQAPEGRATRILVTLPTEAATDGELVRQMAEHGMDAARVNGAHDDPPCWEQMVRRVREAADRVGRPIPVLVDLPGPKIRTGPVAPGPPVVRLRPRRDAWGRSSQPARLLLVAAERPGPTELAPWPQELGLAAWPQEPGLTVPAVPVAGVWLDRRAVGEHVRLHDTRGSARVLTVVAQGPGWALVDVPDTTYIITGTVLTAGGTEATVGDLPATEQWLVLRPGDVLTVTADQTPASPSDAGRGGVAGRPGTQRIGCTSAEALACVAVGQRILFDDGRIGGTAEAVRPGEVDVRITQANPTGSRLRAEKGINLPDSDLELAAYTEVDDEVLRFAVAHGDLVGISFAQRPADVRAVQERLAALGGDGLGIVLKIETARGFAELPALLLTAMASPRVGVMIARGDLAVECGFERLAEQQEEMLALCDAAHVPVIWATEVLDRLARTGRPSRAEISDAAMAGRAECVMLNKGPHITEALETLDDILRRMSSHQRKKVALLRRLRSWSTDGGVTRVAPAGPDDRQREEEP